MPQTNESCELSFCAGYIIPPCKGLEQRVIQNIIKGSSIGIETIPKDFFIPLFAKQPDKYPIDIVFKPEGGVQQNSVRSLIRKIVFEDPDEKQSVTRELAILLAKASDKRSPTGLFIIMTGSIGDLSRILLWKFPADETLQAIVSSIGISIQLLQDAFSRKSTYFKAAMFEGSPAEDSFWKGKIEDKQAKHRIKEVSEFWILNFLNAAPALTDARGTKILSKGFRETIKKIDSVEKKSGLIDAVNVIKSQSGNNISIRECANRYMAEDVRDIFIKCAGGKAIADAIFKIDRDVLSKELKIKSVTLDNLFTVRGPLEEFDNVVTIATTSEEGVVEVCLKGTITSELIQNR